jgi:ribosomal protein S18 acetylase RimI-like enzyme
VYEVRRLGPGDVPATGAVLGRAFCDNPAYRALLPHMSDAQRAEAVGRIKRGFATAAVKCQEAQGVWMDGRLAGASLVCAPGQYPHGISAFLSHALGCTRTGWRGIVNLLRADTYITRRHVRGEHYYLFVLGVDPDFQRRGVGRRLLDELNARADAAGLPCYLETDKPTSVELYRSVGYEVCTEEDVPGVPGMHMWTMLRPGSHSTHTSVLPILAT